MPELPEVHTTVEGLKRTVVGLKISDVWTSYKSDYAPYKNQVKNPSYFRKFKKVVLTQKIVGAERRHKNILIHLSNNQTILIHMKMTGHLIYGRYVRKNSNLQIPPNTKWDNEAWRPHPDEQESLYDPFNRHIRFVFSFTNGKQLVLSDVRKFAKISLHDRNTLDTTSELSRLGPEPLKKNFTYNLFKKQILTKPKTPIKSVLMDGTVVAGIGNIYSDEILFESCVHPESQPQNIPEEVLRNIFRYTKIMLRKGIAFGGDSTSDYRDITGAPGRFQGKHNAYRKTGELCPKNDGGIIKRKVIRGRSAHFCPIHQKKY